MEETEFSRLMRAIGLLGLNHNWVVGIVALCAQEIAIRKKIGIIGRQNWGTRLPKNS
jgi:hypothetical protein